jgi:hypothetical protein
MSFAVRSHRLVIGSAISIAAAFSPLPALSDVPVTCNLQFSLQDPMVLGAIQFSANYSATTGAIPGTGTMTSCTKNPLISILSSNDDDAGTVKIGLVDVEGAEGPMALADCVFQANSVPLASQIVITEQDAGPVELSGNTTSVCAAPETGMTPPFARDALVILRHAIGYGTTCQDCECDVNVSGAVTASDSLISLRAAVGIGSPVCDVCIGVPASVPPTEAITITAALDCTYPCPPVPDPSCGSGTSSSLTLFDDPANLKDSIKWKLGHGPALVQSDLGDPAVGTTYSLCIYDSTGGVFSKEAEITMATGIAWTTKDPKGFQYKDKDGLAAGVTKVSLKTGDAGKSKISVQAKGPNLVMPVPFSATEIFDADTVTVQLHNDTTPECWSAEFPAFSKNTATKFSAKY